MQLSYDAMYRALVTSTADPTNSGKIRVQCPQISGLAEIRAAEPANPMDMLPAVGSTVWIAFNGGDLTKPIYFSNSSAIEIHPNGSVSLTSLATAADADSVRALALSGDDSQPSGTFNTPMLMVTDEDGTSAADISVSGSVYASNLIGTPETWITPTFTSTWASTATLNGTGGYRRMQYRRDAEDNVWVLGGALSSGTGGTIFNLPAAYHNAGVRHLLSAWVLDAGTPKAVMAQVTEAGSVNIATALTGVTVASGTQVFINDRFPLGNLS